MLTIALLSIIAVLLVAAIRAARRDLETFERSLRLREVKVGVDPGYVDRLEEGLADVQRQRDAYRQENELLRSSLNTLTAQQPKNPATIAQTHTLAAAPVSAPRKQCAVKSCKRYAINGRTDGLCRFHVPRMSSVT